MAGERLLRMRDLAAKVGLCERVLFEYRALGREPRLPEPVTIGGSKRYVESEIEAWIEQLKAARDAARTALGRPA